MFLLVHGTEEDVKASSTELKKLGSNARRMLSECIEHQIATRKKISSTLESLYDAGFVFIRETGTQWNPELTITPSLAGEEALEYLEKLEAGIVNKREEC